jgi:hypothetical protein
MRTALAFAALLLPLAASAQVSLTSDLSSGTSPQIYIGRAACKTQVINFRWDVGSGHPTAAEEIDIIHARSTGTCAATSPSNVSAPDTDNVAPSQAQTGTDQVKASAMILDPGDGGFPGGCDNTDRKSSNPYTTYYCIELRPTTGATPAFASIPVNFAMANPTPPQGLAITAGDQHLKVNWSAGDPADNIATYDVHVLAADAGLTLAKYAQRVSATTNADVQKTDDGAPLQDDVPYTVEVVANDSYGNTSDPSAPATGTPKHILDFYSLYRDEGGSAGGGGGCSSTGAATWIATLVIAVGLLARRRRLFAAAKKSGGAALLVAFAVVAPAARAEWRAPERPPRKLLVAFKLDRYDPRIDSEPAFAGLAPSNRPYFQIFRGRAPLRYQLEVDWEVAHPFGSVLVGATAGYWQNLGKGLTADTRQPSGDTALLDVIPFGVIATWRFDWFADRWPRFPFIPYAQAGLMRALWASFSGTGAVSKDIQRGGRGSGWTSGYTAALGFALNLDAIDPDLAREAYLDTGIQRTSLFAEYGWTQLDGFHKAGALILSDRAWRFGLAMEF